MNLAIHAQNFRCFELMLSILLNARETFISRNFLADLRSMLDMEAPSVDMFFDSKMVETKACSDIDKVRWTIEDEFVQIPLKSQLFTRKDIHRVTCPRLEEDEEAEEVTQKSAPEARAAKNLGTSYTLAIHAQL